MYVHFEEVSVIWNVHYWRFTIHILHTISNAGKPTTTTGKLQSSSVVVSTPSPDTKPPPPTAASTEQPTERELGRDYCGVIGLSL